MAQSDFYRIRRQTIKLRRAAAEQRQRIAKLDALGHSTRYAEHALETILKLLNSFEAQERARERANQELPQLSLTA